MKKMLFLFVFALATTVAFGQVICNPAGTLMIYTNYDGGYLTINVDTNIANLKIGVVSYEGVQINITGTYAANVTAVTYAGFEATHQHCGATIPVSINGTSGGCVNTILHTPAATLSNTYGHGTIICATSCSVTTYQGGCNTADQVEDFFQNQFPGSIIFAHKVQSGCWTGEQTLSSGGTCCVLLTGMNPIPETPAIKITPRPAANQLYVIIDDNKISQIRILNILGEAILTSAVADETTIMDVSGLAPGIYFLRAEGKNECYTEKILIER